MTINAKLLQYYFQVSIKFILKFKDTNHIFRFDNLQSLKCVFKL